MTTEAFNLTVGMLEATGLAGDASVEQRRASIDALEQLLPLASGTSIEHVTVGEVPAAWIGTRPPDPEGPAVLWLHGGGYNIGSIASHRAAASHLAAAADLPVVLVEYRLAPEHPFPAALDDAGSAWEGLISQGFDPGTLGVVGDSAGGGLALALALRLRANRAPLPAAMALLCPWVDLTGGHPIPDERLRSDVVLNPSLLNLWATAYAADAELSFPDISPLFADLDGLPPLRVEAAGRDILLDDARRLVDRAIEAGVSAELVVDADMIHAWHLFAGAFPEAADALNHTGAWLRGLLTG